MRQLKLPPLVSAGRRDECRELASHRDSGYLVPAVAVK